MAPGRAPRADRHAAGAEGRAPGELELLAKRIPLGRLVLPEHIADAVLFYCSARAAMVTGASLDVDGGIWLGMQDMKAYFAARRRG